MFTPFYTSFATKKLESAGPTTPCRLTESPSFGNPLPILSLSLSVTAQGGETSCQTLVYWTQITRHHRLLNFDIAFLVPFLNPEDINRKSDICNILETGFLINHWEVEMKIIFVLCQYICMPNNTYLCISIRYECPDRHDWESFIFCQTNNKTFRFVESDKKHLCHKMIQINCWQEEAL